MKDQIQSVQTASLEFLKIHMEYFISEAGTVA